MSFSSATMPAASPAFHLAPPGSGSDPRLRPTDEAFDLKPANR
jgi:hypothetical protein